MKKLLSILGTITLIGTSTTSLAACNNDKHEKKDDELAQLAKLKEENKIKKFKWNSRANGDISSWFNDKINNIIYFGTSKDGFAGNLYKLDLINGNNTPTKIKGIEGPIYHMLKVQDSLYIATKTTGERSGILYKINTLNDEIKKLFQPEEHLIFSLYYYNNFLYIGTTEYDKSPEEKNGNLYKLDLSNETNTPTKIKGIDEQINCLAVINNNLYIGTRSRDYYNSGNLYKLDLSNETNTPTKITSFDEQIDFLTVMNKNLYIETEYDYIYKLDIDSNTISKISV